MSPTTCSIPIPTTSRAGTWSGSGGLGYTLRPHEEMGRRIDDMRIDGVPVEADKTYRVAGWAPVAEGASGEPVWEVVEAWLESWPRVSERSLNLPRLVGVDDNPGMA